MNYIEALRNRYSVKKFDKAKTIDSQTLKSILEAGKLSASSLGLQPYKMYIAESEAIKESLKEAFFNPSQISTCSHLVAIVVKKEIDETYIDRYFDHISAVRETPVENLAPFRKSINNFRNLYDKNSTVSWNEKQAYIVLANLMFAAALEGVDSCPMEGFIPEKINEILDLETDKEHVTVTLALGYRAEDDIFQNFTKVRKPDDRLYKFL